MANEWFAFSVTALLIFLRGISQLLFSAQLQMTSKPKAQVLVVGAGPSGLALALSLVRNGIPVRIIEKRETTRPGQRGAGLSPRSMEMFHFLGVADGIASRYIDLPTIRMYKLPNGTEIVHDVEMLPKVKPTPDKPFANYMCLGQETIRAVIEDKLKELGCHVELGVQLQALEDKGKEGVNVQLAHHGRIEEPEKVTFEYVVGADGAKGLTRKALDFSFLGETKTDNFIIGDFQIDGLSMERWHQWGSVADVMVALRPTEIKGVFNLIMGGLGLKNHASIIETDDSLIDFIMAHTGNRTDFKIVKVRTVGHYIVNVRMTERFGRGRIWLAGDSAHVHSPFGGQGMNCGLQDSFNLGWKLALVVNGFAPQSLLETYTDERIPVIAELLDLTTWYLKRSGSQPFAKDSGWKRTESIKQYGVNVRSSSIVIDEEELDAQEKPVGSAYHSDGSGILYAGDRAPDATGLVKIGGDPVEKSTRLFDLFSPSRHTVLIFADRAEDQLQRSSTILSKYPKDLVHPVVIVGSEKFSRSVGEVDYEVFKDRDEHADGSYFTGRDGASNGIFIVRPDGTIGARLRKVETAERYFRGVFGDRFGSSVA